MGIFDRLDRLADQLGDLIVPDDVRTHVELGAAYLERGDLDAAITELSRAVEARPDHPRAVYLLGLARARNREDEQAIELLGRAAALRGGFAEAQLALAEVHRGRGELEAAKESYKAAIADAGALADASLRGEVYRGLGAVYLASGRVDKAVRELRKAVASLPEDGEVHALLGRALLIRGDLDGARVALERGKAHAHSALPLGEVYERLGRRDEAELSFERALSLGGETEVGARVGLARLRLSTGNIAAAHEQVMRALAVTPDRPDLLVVLGRVQAAAASPEAALDAFDRALVATGAPANSRLLFDRRAVLEEGLSTALRAGLYARGEDYARALLVDQPNHAHALALTAILDGDAEKAARAVQAADTVETRLAAAHVALQQKSTTQAAAALRRAAQLAPSDPRPRTRLAELYRADHERGAADLYALLHQAHRFFARSRELAELSPEAGRLVETLDRPLVVTVMGEFNAGKSTFVNALLGEEVAPMGITPTTATINILKYGTERRGRVVYLDDRVREVAWDEVPKLLKGLRAEEAKTIRVVEVLYPLETLQRVNVVDTPGLNSIHPEHEETARKFIAEADAVVWLFSVDQAAKATEGAALGKIRAEGKKILGVLNKIDRATDEEVRQIVAHVNGALGEHLETIVGCSARQALLGRRGDAEALAASNFAALQQALEERFFSRARAIQREAARTRLAALFDRAQASASALLDDKRLDAIAGALRAVRADSIVFERELLPGERRRLALEANEVYTQCAREVLDFVRPRRWVFGSHEAAPADRDFLLQVLEERLGALLYVSRERIAGEARSAVESVRAIDTGVEIAGELRLLDEQVYGRFRAFARGYLLGGRVDDFFTRVLPKIDLNEREIRRALERDAPYTDEIAEAELHAPLAAWAGRFFDGLQARLERARAEVELERLDVEERLLAPIEMLRAALQHLA